MSPFKALYGKDPPVVMCYEISPTDLVSVQEQLRERDAILQQLKLNLLKVLNRHMICENDDLGANAYTIASNSFSMVA